MGRVTWPNRENDNFLVRFIESLTGGEILDLGLKVEVRNHYADENLMESKLRIIRVEVYGFE